MLDRDGVHRDGVHRDGMHRDGVPWKKLIGRSSVRVHSSHDFGQGPMRAPPAPMTIWIEN